MTHRASRLLPLLLLAVTIVVGATAAPAAQAQEPCPASHVCAFSEKFYGGEAARASCDALLRRQVTDEGDFLFAESMAFSRGIALESNYEGGPSVVSWEPRSLINRCPWTLEAQLKDESVERIHLGRWIPDLGGPVGMDRQIVFLTPDALLQRLPSGY